MFSIFEKKKEVIISELVISLMNYYLKECEGSIVAVDEEPKMKEEYNRLMKLGLGQTENAKILKTKLDVIKQKRSKSDFGKAVIRYIKKAKEVFPNSYLISFDQFLGVIQKYDLQVGRLIKYTGVIPTKNIEEIEKVSYSVKSNDELVQPLCLGRYSKDYRYSLVLRISLGNPNKTSLKNANILLSETKKHGNLLKDQYSRYNIGTIRTSNVPDMAALNDWISNTKANLSAEKNNSHFYFDLYELGQTDLLIAAPSKCFSEDFKVSKFVTDPIVFQPCPYGILVHSVWGEEADDKVLEKYRQLNQSLL